MIQDFRAGFAWQAAVPGGLTIVFTVLAFLSRVRAALHWPKPLRQSTGTNFLIIRFTSLNGALYLVLIAPLAVF